MLAAGLFWATLATLVLEVLDTRLLSVITWYHLSFLAVSVALPYHIRRGRVAIIGVGGGRDVLTALWARSPAIVGIEINGTLLDALRGPYRTFTGIAADPSVTLVHDEARSYLARTADRFDVLQMSLIDTWAATGAGAFTLSENGLYTREAWQTLLGLLTPDGVLCVSRWFAPGVISEATRLVSLGTAALLDAGIGRPRDHLILATRGPVATLMLSRAPFTDADSARLDVGRQRRVRRSGVDRGDRRLHVAGDHGESPACGGAVRAARLAPDAARAVRRRCALTVGSITNDHSYCGPELEGAIECAGYLHSRPGSVWSWPSPRLPPLRR